MAYSSLEQASQEVELDVAWRAFELRPEEVRAYDQDAIEEKKRQIEAFWPRVQSVAKEHYGLDMKQGPFGIDTRSAHVGAKLAREAGVEEAYHRAVFEAYWQDQTDISRREELGEIAASIGLDPAAFVERLGDEGLRTAVREEEEGAARLGIRGVPAIIIEDRYLISGAQPAETLVEVFRRYEREGTLQ